MDKVKIYVTFENDSEINETLEKMLIANGTCCNAKIFNVSDSEELIEKLKAEQLKEFGNFEFYFITHSTSQTGACGISDNKELLKNITETIKPKTINFNYIACEAYKIIPISELD